MLRRRTAIITGLTLCLTISLNGPLGGPSATAADTSEPDPRPAGQVEPLFTFDRVRAAIPDGSSQGPQSAAVSGAPTATELGLHAMRLDNVYAAVNTSLVDGDGGAISAATSEFVDLAWSPMHGVEKYAVEREGELVGTTTDTAFRVSDVSPGERVNFRISAIAPPVASGPTPVYGLFVEIPSTGDAAKAAAQQVSELAIAARYDFASLDWVTFIPMDKVNAPPIGIPTVNCEYQYGYQFGGDNRGFASSPSESSNLGYRSFFNVSIAWARASGIVQSVGPSFGATKVYDADTGQEVDWAVLQRSESYWEARLLSGNTETADVRVAMSAGNPFCVGNSIEGAFTMTVTRAGNYAILSGQHRMMPNYEIFLTSYGTGNRTIVYQRQYTDPLCLVNWACPEAEMGGWQGSY